MAMAFGGWRGWVEDSYFGVSSCLGFMVFLSVSLSLFTFTVLQVSGLSAGDLQPNASGAARSLTPFTALKTELNPVQREAMHPP